MEIQEWNSRKYEYVMDEAEIRECCLFLLWEYAKCQKRTWIRFALILAAELILIPKIMALTTLVVFLMLVIVGLNHYAVTAKALRGQPSAVWIEGDRLKAQRGDYGEIPCTDIQMVRRTKRLLLMGYMQGDKRQMWFAIPLRAFADGQEVEQFLAMLRDPQIRKQTQGEERWKEQNRSQGQEPVPQTAQVDLNSQRNEEVNETGAAGQMAGGAGAYLCLSCQMNGERWVRLQKGAADLVNGGSLGTTARFRGMILWLCSMPFILFAISWLTAKKIDLPIIFLDLALSVWMAFQLFYRDPEKRIRKQVKTPQALLSVCGQWQFSLTAEGICIDMPANRKNVYRWESLSSLLETEDAFYFFASDKRRFFAIPKENFVSWEQADLFHRICADHGIQKIMPKKARYVPGWLMWALLGVILLTFLGVAAVKISLDKRSVPGYVSDGYRRVTLEEQVAVLESLGLSVPEETVKSVRSSMEEYDLYDMVEENPYTWLLTDMGAPSRDEKLRITGYAAEVFWFDFEGFDISTDYIDVLNGMAALAKGSCLDEVTDIQEDMTEADWENGKGVVRVSLSWKGQTYSYAMEMDYDWIDPKVLGIFDPFLEQEGSQKYFYATWDNGQGAIVFFCTPEWAKQFTEKTGLVLEKYTN